MLKIYINQEDILAKFQNSSDKHLTELAESFLSSIESNNDSDIFQHMYLQTVGITLNKFNSKLPNDCKALNRYSSKFGTEGVYNLVRKKVMHPVRPILSDRKSINQIDELLTDYVDIKDIIEKHYTQHGI